MSWKQSPVAPGSTLAARLTAIALEGVPARLHSQVAGSLGPAIFRVAREFWVGKVDVSFVIPFVKAMAEVEVQHARLAA